MSDPLSEKELAELRASSRLDMEDIGRLFATIDVLRDRLTDVTIRVTVADMYLTTVTEQLAVTGQRLETLTNAVRIVDEAFHHTGPNLHDFVVKQLCDAFDEVALVASEKHDRSRS